jgi:hypothetical protein
MSDSYKLFQAGEYPLEVFNLQPIVDFGFQFVYTDCDGVDQPFELTGFIEAYLKVYNERLGRVVKTWELTLLGTDVLALNTQDTEFDVNGNYWYEVFYIMSGGYEIRLRFGKLIVK